MTPRSRGCTTPRPTTTTTTTTTRHVKERTTPHLLQRLDSRATVINAVMMMVTREDHDDASPPLATHPEEPEAVDLDEGVYTHAHTQHGTGITINTLPPPQPPHAPIKGASIQMHHHVPLQA
jgi:hypothetical protein